MSDICACGNVRLLQWQDHKRDTEGRCHARSVCFMHGELVTDENHQHEFVARWVCECGVQDDPVCSGDYRCSEESPCHCCLAAEVERLTAELADRDQRIEAALHVLDTSQTDNAADLEQAIRAALRGDS